MEEFYMNEIEDKILGVTVLFKNDITYEDLIVTMRHLKDGPVHPLGPNVNYLDIEEWVALFQDTPAAHLGTEKIYLLFNYLHRFHDKYLFHLKNKFVATKANFNEEDFFLEKISFKTVEMVTTQLKEQA